MFFSPKAKKPKENVLAPGLAYMEKSALSQFFVIAIFISIGFATACSREETSLSRKFKTGNSPVSTTKSGSKSDPPVAGEAGPSTAKPEDPNASSNEHPNCDSNVTLTYDPVALDQTNELGIVPIDLLNAIQTQAKLPLSWKREDYDFVVRNDLAGSKTELTIAFTNPEARLVKHPAVRSCGGAMDQKPYNELEILVDVGIATADGSIKENYRNSLVFTPDRQWITSSIRLSFDKISGSYLSNIAVSNDMTLKHVAINLAFQNINLSQTDATPIAPSGAIMIEGSLPWSSSVIFALGTF